MICRIVDSESGYACESCGRPSKIPNLKRVCKNLSTAPRLPAVIEAEAKKEAKSRGVLAGDLIAEMTKSLGIPPCGRCDVRRKWLNAAHAWLKGEDWRKEL